MVRFGFGYSPYIYSALLPHLLRLPAGNDSVLGVQLKSAHTREGVERVLRGQLHAALGIHPVDDRTYGCDVSAPKVFRCVFPKNHPLARKADVTIEDLDHEQIFWLPTINSILGFYNNVTRYVKSTGIEAIFKEVGGQAHALELASEGFGLALFAPISGSVYRERG